MNNKLFKLYLILISTLGQSEINHARQRTLEASADPPKSWYNVPVALPELQRPKFRKCAREVGCYLCAAQSMASVLVIISNLYGLKNCGKIENGDENLK